jgi:hypothetical protein
VQKDALPFIPKEHRHSSVSGEVLDGILKEAAKERDRYEQGLRTTKPNTLIVIDDCVDGVRSRESLFGSPQVTELFTLGRHYFLTVVALCQSISSSLNPICRKNADLIVYFRAPSAKDRKTLVDEYLTISDGRTAAREGSDFINRISEEQYSSVVIDKYRSQYARGLSDFVRRYRAKPGKRNFMIGKQDVAFRTIETPNDDSDHPKGILRKAKPAERPTGTGKL